MAAIPEDLLAQLRQANERFAAIRERYDRRDQMDYTERDRLSADLTVAQREFDEINERIWALLHQK